MNSYINETLSDIKFKMMELTYQVPHIHLQYTQSKLAEINSSLDMIKEIIINTSVRK